MKVSELLLQIDSGIAPFSLVESWDNGGLLVGDRNADITAVLICLDITIETIEEAIRCGANVLVSHHPVIFGSLKALRADSLPYRLAAANLSAICIHSNLDLVQGGVNDCLARALKLQEIQPLKPLENGASLGRVGNLPAPLSTRDFAAFVWRTLDPSGGVRYADGGKPISRVAVCGGAGKQVFPCALAVGAQALLTGEISHDVFLDASALGLTVLDAGHFDTERVVLEPLALRLAQLASGTAFLVSKQQSPVRLYAGPSAHRTE